MGGGRVERPVASETDQRVRALASKQLGPFAASQVALRTAGPDEVVIAAAPH